MNGHRERWAIAGLFAAVVLVRVAVLLAVLDAHPDRMIVHDTPGYVGPALSLLHDGDYDRSPDTSAPEFQRTPGYPAFVAVVYWATDESNTAVVVVQALLSGLSVLLAVAVVRRLTGSAKAGLAVGVLVAVDPLTNSQIGLLATETLATVLVMLTAYCAVRMVQADLAARWAAATALALVAATYVRPTTYFFPLVVVALFAVVGFRRRHDPATRARILRATAAFAVPCVVLLGAWNLHNQAEVGSWRFSGIDATNLYWYRAAAVVADRDGTDRQQVQMDLTEELAGPIDDDDPHFDEYRGGAPPPGWEHRQGEYYNRAQDEALAILRSEPALTAREVRESLVGQVVQSGWATASKFFFSSAPDAVGLGVPVMLGLQALGVLGAAVTLRRSDAPDRLAHVILVAIVVETLLVSTLGADGANGYRLRVPVWPIWCFYAVVAVRAVAERFWQRSVTHARLSAARSTGPALTEP